MAALKSFLKKNEKIIVVIATLLFVYFIMVFNQKINFLLGNELIVYLSPGQKSFNMHYGDFAEINFSAGIDNSAYCKAKCEYSFNDRSSNNVIDKGSFVIAKNSQIHKPYNLSVKRLGSGQDIYSFDLSCRSIASPACLTRSPEKSRSSLIIVNYDLTAAEKELKKTLRKNLTELLKLLSETDIAHQMASQKYFELGHRINLKNLTKEKIILDDKYGKIRISIENLRRMWSMEEYIKLNEAFNNSYFESAEGIKKSIAIFDSSIEAAAETHNEILGNLSRLAKKLNETLALANLLEDSAALKLLSSYIGKFNDTSSQILENMFDSYESLSKSMIKLANDSGIAINQTKIPAAMIFAESSYLADYENNILCSLAQECTGNFSSDGITEMTGIFLHKFPNSSDLRKNCNSLAALNQKHELSRNEASKIIRDKNTAFEENEWLLNLSSNFIGNLIRTINNSYYDSFQKIMERNVTNPDALRMIDGMLPRNRTNSIEINYNQSINLSLYLLSKINLSHGSFNLLEKCGKLSQTSENLGLDFKLINTSIFYKIITNINTNLSDNPAVCCVFNDCRPCCNDDSCRNDPKSFPVVFVHGHSLAKDNSPEFSLDSFNKIQTRLQENGYLNAGIVSLYSKNEPTEKGIWGMSGKPITVKISYYYDAFRKDDKYIVIPTKSENIDAYAVRLKEIIEIIKERTSKPKVNIIAHSMGGLVTRRYMQIFGSHDTDKIIMIATPNQGVSGSVGNYCGIIGENRECQDMLKDSLFINKLNDPSKQPQNARIYSIVGQGCKTGNSDGDGIVPAESAKLENSRIFYVNGSCWGFFGEVLHTEMLNTDKYPRTYNIIKEILNE